MSDDKQRNSNGSEPRSGGNVWFVLIAIVSAVLLSAFLFGGSDMRLRYPDLMKLLAAMAEARQADIPLTPDNDQGNLESHSNVVEAGGNGENAARSKDDADAAETESAEIQTDPVGADGTGIAKRHPPRLPLSQKRIPKNLAQPRTVPMRRKSFILR